MRNRKPCCPWACKRRRKAVPPGPEGGPESREQGGAAPPHQTSPYVRRHNGSLWISAALQRQHGWVDKCDLTGLHIMRVCPLAADRRHGLPLSLVLMLEVTKFQHQGQGRRFTPLFLFTHRGWYNNNITKSGMDSCAESLHNVMQPEHLWRRKLKWFIQLHYWVCALLLQHSLLVKLRIRLFVFSTTVATNCLR